MWVLALHEAAREEAAAGDQLGAASEAEEQMASELVECDRCGCSFPHFGYDDEGPTCVLCQYLGDRALVPFLKDPTSERLTAFRAAPPGWLRYQREATRRTNTWHRFR